MSLGHLCSTNTQATRWREAALMRMQLLQSSFRMSTNVMLPTVNLTGNLRDAAVNLT
jgi:hypothetical protein